MGIIKKVSKKVNNTTIFGRELSDGQFRAALVSGGSMTWNFLYGIFNLILAIIYGSVWYVTMFVYYLILGLMRLSLVTLEIKGSERRNERSVMRHTGIAFLVLSVVIAGSVALAFAGKLAGNGKIVEIMIATVTFFLTVLAIINIVKAHRQRSPFMISLRNISLAGAAASMLSLERSMIATFGGSGARTFFYTVQGISGMVVFLLVVTFGISMIIWSYKMEKNKEGTE